MSANMEEKLYTIRNGKVTLYVRREYGGEKFDFKGLTVEGDNSYYAPYADKDSRTQLDDGNDGKIEPSNDPKNYSSIRLPYSYLAPRCPKTSARMGCIQKG